MRCMTLTHLPVILRAQVVRLYGGRVARSGRGDVHGAAAAGPEVANAGRDGVERVQRLPEGGERQRLHVPLDVGVCVRGAAAGEAAEGGGRHGHGTSALQGKLHAHHDAGEGVAVQAVHRAAAAREVGGSE
jgi:hypothetical protein